MNIFKLVGSVYVDAEQANKSIAKTDTNATNLAQKFASGAKKAAAFGGALVGMATVAVGAITKLTTAQLGTLDAIDKSSKRMGLSTKEYQEWDYILRQNGASIDNLEKGMKTFSAQIEGVNSGASKASLNFHELGISIYDSNNVMKSQDVLMNEALFALADMDAGTEQTRLAIELFGQAGMDMLPMLQGGSESMEALREQANALGLVIGDDLITDGVTLADTIDNIKSAFSAMGTEIGTAAIPIIQEFADMIVNNLPAIREMFGALSPIIKKLMETLMPPVMRLVDMVLPFIIDLLEELTPIFTEIIDAILPPIIDIIEALLPPLMDIVKMILPVVLTVLQAIIPVIKTVLEVITPIINLLVEILKPILEWFTNYISEGLKKNLGNIQEIMDGLKTALNGIIKFISGVFSGDWKKAWEGIKDVFKGIFNSLPAIVEVVLNNVVTVVNNMIDGINKITGKIGIPEIPNIPDVKLPRFAKGGIVDGPTTAIVGEDGAEAVIPLEKNREWIASVAKEMNSQIDSNSKLIGLLESISDKLDNMESIVNVKLVPDDRKLFDVVREQSVRNAKMGGRPITV